MDREQQLELDAVAAYDRVAPWFAPIQAARHAYCDAIDCLIAANLPAEAHSMLDVGSGDGIRAEGIAGAVSELVFLEPSTGMRRLIRSQREVWTSRIEESRSANRNFDVITCLWNVLGHVASQEKRLQALRNMLELLSTDGVLFLDVQNRYNARHYGALKTAARMVYDRIRPSQRNGDVTVRWPTEGGPVAAYGHVFTRKEMLLLFREADLSVKKSLIIDYATGEICSSQLAGSMFFILGR